MEQRPVAQGTGNNVVVNVYQDRVELWTGWQSENVDSLALRRISEISAKGIVNCTLTIQLNDGRRISVERMAPPDARRVKSAIERQKQLAGSFE